MTKLSKRSLLLLRDAHPLLNALCLRVAASGVPFRVIWSFRGEADQNAAFAAGNSKARWGQSPHNFRPSAAIDFAPGWSGPIDWNDRAAFDRVGKAFEAAAADLQIPIRRFKWDGPHIELHPWRKYVKREFKPKPMLASTTNWAAGASMAAGLAASLRQVWDAFDGIPFWVPALIAVAAGAWIIRERWKKARDYGV